MDNAHQTAAGDMPNAAHVARLAMLVTPLLMQRRLPHIRKSRCWLCA